MVGFQLGAPTRCHAGRGHFSFMDRLLCSAPWLDALAGVVKCVCVCGGTPEQLRAEQISDHAAACAAIVSRRSVPEAERPIPRGIFRSAEFK
eukprot:2590298-Pyramimonas_sp.AAC.1